MKNIGFIVIVLSLWGMNAQTETLEPTLENIKWISGNWKAEALGGIAEENWSEP